MANQNDVVIQGVQLEGCTVSSDGGKTSQTLAQWTTNIQDMTAQIVSVNQTATDVQKQVGEVKQQVSGLNLDKYYSRDNAFQPNCTTALDVYGNWVAGKVNAWNSTNLYIGYALDKNNAAQPDNTSQLIFNYSIMIGGKANKFQGIYWNNKNMPHYSFGGKNLHPENGGSADLGFVGHEWANIYSQTAVQVTSDKNFKTVTSSFDDKATEADQKLLKALYQIDGVTYKMNDAIKEKGEDKARLHTGFIAQDVEKAITDAGLNPSDYAMWTQDALSETQNVSVDTKDAADQSITNKECVAVKDAEGNQVYKQSLRYEELFSVLFAAHKQEIEALKQEVSALKAKVGA